jgi:hypothetical protein
MGQKEYGSQPFVYEEGNVEGKLASDIQMQADQIWRGLEEEAGS